LVLFAYQKKKVHCLLFAFAPVWFLFIGCRF